MAISLLFHHLKNRRRGIPPRFWNIYDRTSQKTDIFCIFVNNFFPKFGRVRINFFHGAFSAFIIIKILIFVTFGAKKEEKWPTFSPKDPPKGVTQKYPLSIFRGSSGAGVNLTGAWGAAPTNIGHTLANLYTNILAVGGNTFGAKLPKIGAEVTIWKHFGKFFSKCITRNVVLSQILEKISPPGILFLFLYFLLLYDSTILASVRLREISLNFNKKSVHFVNMWIFNRISLRKTLKI